MSNKNILRLHASGYNLGMLSFLILIFSSCLLPSANCFSQSIVNSPYSRYGLGDLQPGNYASNLAMGGISNALQNDTTAPFNINSANPASHASSRLTIFDFGLLSNMTQLETDAKKSINNRTGFSYAAFVFPVSKWWGTSVGLRPYSNVGYKIYDQRTQDSIGTVNYSYNGTGGINQIFWGNGFRIKKLYVGVNVSYLFGDIIYNSTDSFASSSYNMDTKVIQTTTIHDLYYTLGMQYRQPLGKGWSLTLGATGSMQTDLNAKQSTSAESYSTQFGLPITKDPVIDTTISVKISIPMMVGGGFVIKKSEKLLIGFDYSMQNWSSFSAFGESGL